MGGINAHSGSICNGVDDHGESIHWGRHILQILLYFTANMCLRIKRLFFLSASFEYE